MCVYYQHKGGTYEQRKVSNKLERVGVARVAFCVTALLNIAYNKEFLLFAQIIEQEHAMHTARSHRGAHEQGFLLWP